MISRHFYFANNLGNLLSISTYDISISVDLAHSWHSKCMNHIDQTLSEVHISLQEIHGSNQGNYSQKESTSFHQNGISVHIFPHPRRIMQIQRLLINMQNPQNPTVQSVNPCRKLYRREVTIWDPLLLLETSKQLLPKEQVHDSHYSA